MVPYDRIGSGGGRVNTPSGVSEAGLAGPGWASRCVRETGPAWICRVLFKAGELRAVQRGRLLFPIIGHVAGEDAHQRRSALGFSRAGRGARWRGEERHPTQTMAPAEASAPVLTTSAVLMSASKHISARCGRENRAFLACKKADENPEKCLKQGEEVTRCVLSLLKELHLKCPKEMDGYAKCMDYYGSEFELCRKQQASFENSCPL
ncbi:hypothetical protein CBR_g31386 [Chara braunii]|uniref:Uncharacterized protein n=1 Tax=Chara braunii TaxID=69332 RepID=A0A388LET9_CHABU|nr:hypothetical protein CBR_g31386 [Chara braunii]|eukprot:GBG80830.1 hypothetical protein CBR_g31386 [Chara braunii]